MSPLESHSLSRRNLIGVALSTTLFPSALRAFAEEQKKTTPSEYKLPYWDSPLSVEEVATKTPCKAKRMDSHLAHGVTSKIFTERFHGPLKVASLKHLVENGWVRQERQFYTKYLAASAKRPPASAQVTDPSPRPKGVFPRHGGGAVVSLSSHGNDRLAFISNNHVVCDASPELIERSVCNHPFDINVIDRDLLSKNATDPHQLPIATLADESINNENICTKKVEMYGFGKDLFHFVGHPFSFTCGMPKFGPQYQSRVVFGLRLPDGFLHSRNEIGGMSGSPVVLEGTSIMVGTVCRVFPLPHVKTPVSCVFFIGPDQIRETAREFASTSK